MKKKAQSRPTAGCRGAAFLLLLLGLVVPSGSFADLFELADGRKLEGTVVGKFGDLVSIRTKDGKVVTVDAADIKKQKSSDTAYDQYLGRKGSVKEGDTAGHLELARWCVEKRLDREAIFHFKQVLTTDPNQPAARDALGYERVKGDWYLQGPEAEAAKAGKPDPFAVPLKEMPEKVDTKKLQKSWSQPVSSGAVSVPSGAPTIQLNLQETVAGEPPKISGMTHLFRQMLAEMKQPMGLVSDKSADAPFTMKAKIDVKFERTQMFYKRLPLYHIYKGTVEITLVDRSTGKPAVKMRKNVPFSASVSLDKKDAVSYAYHHTIMTVLHSLSQNKFFRDRGVKKRKDPNE